jgi:hypothetical protein
MEKPVEMATNAVVRTALSVAKYAFVGYVAKQALITCGKIGSSSNPSTK